MNLENSLRIIKKVPKKRLNNMSKLCKGCLMNIYAKPEEKLFKCTCLEPIATNKSNSEMFNGLMPDVVIKDEFEPLEINEQGGKGSFTGTRMDLIPAKALLEIGKVMFEGAKKYDENNWRNVTVKEHINHAVRHIYEYIDLKAENKYALDEQIELAHAATRILMALELIK